MIRHSNHVTSYAPIWIHLFENLIQIQQTLIISTIMDLYIPANKYNNDSILTIGWSESLNFEVCLFVTEILLEISKKHFFKLLVIGDPLFNMEGINCEAIKWNEKSEVIDATHLVSVFILYQMKNGF